MQYEIRPGVLSSHIQCLNLYQTEAYEGSGSLENLEAGVSIADGLHVVNEKGEVIGWAVAFNINLFRGKETHFYVHPKYRRHGIGRALYAAMREKMGNFAVRPWDSRSGGFFNAVGHYSF